MIGSFYVCLYVHGERQVCGQVAMAALVDAKQAVRQQQADAAGGDAAMPGQLVRIKELDDIVSGRDAAAAAAAPAGGPPRAMAVIDTSGRAPLFFRCAYAWTCWSTCLAGTGLMVWPPILSVSRRRQWMVAAGVGPCAAADGGSQHPCSVQNIDCTLPSPQEAPPSGIEGVM